MFTILTRGASDQTPFHRRSKRRYTLSNLSTHDTFGLSPNQQQALLPPDLGVKPTLSNRNPRDLPVCGVHVNAKYEPYVEKPPSSEGGSRQYGGRLRQRCIKSATMTTSEASSAQQIFRLLLSTSPVLLYSARLIRSTFHFHISRTSIECLIPPLHFILQP